MSCVPGMSSSAVHALFPQTADSKVPFSQLCQLFEKMLKGKNNAVRKEEFQKFLLKWKELPLKNAKDRSFYPALRLILPQSDKERLSYGVKEVLLAKLYVDVLGLSKNGQDAKKLLEYRNPKTNVKSAGDFAEVAFQHVLSKRCISEGNLTIAQVNECLDKIAQYNSDKKKDMMKKTLLDLIQKTSAIEQKWLIRIMLKDTKLRLGHKAILLAFHPDAEEVYNVTTSLRQVCERLHDSSIRLSDTEIELFQPFRPMLALNAKLNEVEKLMDYKQFIVEIKYDGERSQLHKSGNLYKYYSRSGKEYSTVFGETSYNGTLTPYIHDCFSDDVKSCIIDGEMMGYDQSLKIFMQKGGQFDIKHVTEDSELQPCLVVFDLLYLNGKRLTSMKQIERKQLLCKIIKPLDGRVQLAEEKSVRVNEEAIRYLNEAIDRREEGIIVKNPNSVYAPNKRKGSGWFKVKPEYTDGVVDDLDLIIIGGTFGSGRRGNFLSMFHLGVGVRDPKHPSKPPEVFNSFCRVGSGYTDKQLVQVIDKLKPHLKVFEKKKPPGWLNLTKEKPEVYVHPKNSVVVQIRASEILPSSSYATGCTLRFPRLVSIRDDKDYVDALDMCGLEDLKNMADGKLAARHASLHLLDQPAVKKRKVKVEPLTTISDKYQGVDLSSIEQTSTSFEGKIFCVITGLVDNDKKVIERRIAEHGGNVVQNPTSDTFCVVARNLHHLRVKNIIKAGKHDVVRVDWLMRCLDNGLIQPWNPQDMIHASLSTESRFKEKYDKFGDEFSESVTSASLKELFNRISDELVEGIMPDNDAEGRCASMKQFINSVLCKYECHGFHDQPSYLLLGLSFHILQPNNHSNMSRASVMELESLVEFYGGLFKPISEDASHVLVTSLRTDEQLADIFEYRRSHKKKFHIVSGDWLLSCVRQGRVLNESEYSVAAPDSRD